MKIYFKYLQDMPCMLNMSKYGQHAQYAFVLKLFAILHLDLLGSLSFLQQILRNTKAHTVWNKNAFQ